MLQYPFKHIFILGQRRFCQGDIISMTAEAAITIASMMLNYNTGRKLGISWSLNRFCWWSWSMRALVA